MLSYLVIEYNRFLVDEWRACHVLVIYGDTANSAVLDHARLESDRRNLQQITRSRWAGAPGDPTGICGGGRSPPPYQHRYAIPEQQPRPLSEAHRDDFYQRAPADPAR